MIPILFLLITALTGCGGAAGSPAVSTGTASATAANVAALSSAAAALSASSTPGETAHASQSFVDSIGMNIHLSFYGTPYGDDFSSVASLLKALGVLHLRDGVVLGQTNICQEDQQLASSGMRLNYITQPTLQASDLASWASCVGSAIESYEAPNEYDISHPSSDTSWVATLQGFQKTLYAAVKGTPGLTQLQVIGPSLTSSSAYSAVGDLSAYMDLGNMHDYFSGYNPGTTGWGAGGYGSIPWNLTQAASVSGSKPIAATETGYGIAPTQSGISLAAQAKYVPRLFLEQFNAGVPRTYEYELIDEGGAPFDSYGVVSGNLTPKPAYTALRNMISILRDSRANFTLKALNYTLSGNLANVHHALLQKQNGTFFLALWIETMSYDPNTQTDLSVPAQTVSVQVGIPLNSAVLYTYTSTEALRASTLPTTNPITLNLTDSVSILKLVPTSP